MSTVDTSRLSPFEREQLKMLSQIDAARFHIRQYISGEAVGSHRAELASRARSALRTIAPEQLEPLRAAAVTEHREGDFREVEAHAAATRRLYHSAFTAEAPSSIVNAGGSLRDGAGSPTRGEQVPLLGVVTDDGRGGLKPVSAAVVAAGAEQDEAFGATVEQVLAEVRRRDVALEADLDIILAGVQRLRGQASALSAELKRQDALLDEVGDRIDRNDARLVATTQGVIKAIERVRGDSVCMYCVCIMLLLGVAGAIVVVAKW